MRVTLELPKEFLDVCQEDDANPEEVLRGFVADLAGIQNWVHPNPAEGRYPRPRDGYQSNGSDERLRAREYYERVGYPYREN